MFQFVEPSATLITEKDPLKLIESVGRTCYKSEDRITENSARGFVRGLMKSNHTAMVEHSNIVFDISLMDEDDIAVFLSLMSCRFLNVTVNEEESRVLVSGNVRALNEAAGTWTGKEGGAVLLKTLDAHNPNLVYVDEALYRDADADGVKIIDIDTTPNLSLEELAQHKYLSFRLVTDRGVTHELVRHRIPSFGQESTRYVNYMEGIAICLPTGFYERPEIVQMEYQAAFVDADNHYRKLIELGEKAPAGQGGSAYRFENRNRGDYKPRRVEPYLEPADVRHHRRPAPRYQSTHGQGLYAGRHNSDCVSVPGPQGGVNHGKAHRYRRLGWLGKGNTEPPACGPAAMQWHPRQKNYISKLRE